MAKPSPSPTPSRTIPTKVKEAAEKKARELRGSEFYVVWNDVRYGPFTVKK